jgi:hypothetical protein
VPEESCALTFLSVLWLPGVTRGYRGS